MFSEASRFAANNEKEIVIRPVPPLETNQLSLASTSRQLRAEILAYLDSRLLFEIS